MKAVVQRVKKCRLEVDGNEISSINRGLCVYLGVAKNDDESVAQYLADKIVRMRIFEDENGKMNRSVLDEGGEIMVVSQFTLLADTSHGHRPDFFGAEQPLRAEELYVYFCRCLEEYLHPSTGVFGADMQIYQHNDGPVTILLEKTAGELNKLFNKGGQNARTSRG